MRKSWVGKVVSSVFIIGAAVAISILIAALTKEPKPVEQEAEAEAAEAKRPVVYVTYIEEVPVWDITKDYERNTVNKVLAVTFVFTDLTHRQLNFKDFDHLNRFLDSLSQYYDIRIDSGGGYK